MAGHEFAPVIKRQKVAKIISENSSICGSIPEAKKEGVSINQFISSAVSEKVSAVITEDYITSRAERANRKDFEDILKKVPKRPPLPGDEL